MTTARDNSSKNAPKNAMRDTQEKRAAIIKASANVIEQLADCYINGDISFHEMEKDVVTRLNRIIRSLSPFATEDEAIETSGTYWTPSESESNR